MPKNQRFYGGPAGARSRDLRIKRPYFVSAACLVFGLGVAASCVDRLPVNCAVWP
jgi:hypothetical protein